METPKPKQAKVKPTNVTILNIDSQILPTPLGTGIAILILGLGDDNLVYKYNGPKRQWEEQE